MGYNLYLVKNGDWFNKQSIFTETEWDEIRTGVRLLEILFLPVVILAAFPGTALIPGALFVLIYIKRYKFVSKLKRASILLATSLWITYGLYETYMYFWMQTVIAPIRVDLLFIVPILYLITIIALIACRRSPDESRQRTDSKQLAGRK